MSMAAGGRDPVCRDSGTAENLGHADHEAAFVPWVAVSLQDDADEHPVGRE